MSDMPKFTLITTFTFVLTFLTGCGWHLRGSDTNLEAIGSVSINARNTGSDLVIKLKRSLSAQGIDVVDSAGKYHINILDQQTDRRIAAVSGSARVAEYRLISQVTFFIFNNTTPVAVEERRVTQPSTVTAERYFDFEGDRVLANQAERKQLEQSINSSLVQQIITQLKNVASAATPLGT